MAKAERLRLLLVNGSWRRIAGIEVYLEDLLRELATREIDVALLAASGEPEDRPAIQLPEGVPLLRSLSEAAAWKPEAAFCHGRIPADWETEICARYPSAYFIHNYYGTCISGLKRHQRPQPEPCFRVFGPACLLQYLPRGCGGRNPLVMLDLYRQEKAQQQRLTHYRFWITHSESMREEYVRHGFPNEKISLLPFACVANPRPRPETEQLARWEDPVRRILFAGRMEAVKGGAQMLEACARWSQSSGQRVEVCLAGQGEKQGDWQALAESLAAENSNFTVHFPGWLAGAELEAAFATHHLLCMPSLWPEPFGKSGIEAGQFGCPSVGFRIGGIPTWLREGRNGHLADWQGDPVENLSKAIARVFANREHYLALREGAGAACQEFSSRNHVDHLLPLMSTLAGRSPLV